MVQPFHLAIPVTDLEQARQFYGELLGCDMGRSSEQWIDWNFFGHQLVTHCVAQLPSSPQYNSVDSHAVPVPHFGVVLSVEQWHALCEKVRGKVDFVLEPYTRFAGQVGEQHTMFFTDPFGNALEFKAFADMEQLFATDE